MTGVAREKGDPLGKEETDLTVPHVDLPMSVDPASWVQLPTTTLPTTIVLFPTYYDQPIHFYHGRFFAPGHKANSLKTTTSEAWGYNFISTVTMRQHRTTCAVAFSSATRRRVQAGLNCLLPHIRPIVNHWHPSNSLCHLFP